MGRWVSLRMTPSLKDPSIIQVLTKKRGVFRYLPTLTFYNLQKPGTFFSMHQGLTSATNLGKRSAQTQKGENLCGWCEGQG